MSLPVFRLLLITLCAVCASATLWAQNPLVLKGATVIDGLGGPAVPEAVIVIEGDKVKSIGQNATPYPPNSNVIDVSGKFIIPGLIESHSHYEEWMGELYLNHGVTTIMGVGVKAGKRKEISQRNDSRTPRIFDTGGSIRISPTMTQDEVRESIGEWLKGKPDFAKMPDYNERSKQVFQWVAEEIHRAGMMTFGHTENAPESIRAGHDVVEHVWGFAVPQMSREEHPAFQRGGFLHWGTFLRDQAAMDRMIREAVNRKAYLNPTVHYELGSLSRFASKHELEDFELNRDPFLAAYFPKNISESLVQKNRQIRNFSNRYENLVLLSRLQPQEIDEFHTAYRLTGEFIKKFVAAGGKIQAGTDAVSGGTPGISLHQEMELLTEAGLTPMQALQSATLWSAEMLTARSQSGGKPKIGWIGSGSLADLVVLKANPLDDIANALKIERVMKGGRFIELGYTPSYFTLTQPARRIAMATPVPKISSITPFAVIEGTAEFEMTIDGVGFIGNSVVRVEGIAVPTTFVDPRHLKVRIPAASVAKATPNPFDAPGPKQEVGVFGDRTVAISVFTPPPEGGLSNAVFLRIKPKWTEEQF